MAVVLSSGLGGAHAGELGNTHARSLSKVEKKSSLIKLLNQPMDNYFWVSRKEGKFETGNKESFYIKKIDKQRMTYDISNNEVLVNLRYDGSLRCMNFYDSTVSIAHKAALAGLYTSSSNLIMSGELQYNIRIGETLFDLSKVDWPLKTGYLKGTIPQTCYEVDGLSVKLVAFAPISEDGKETPRLGVYGISLENISKGPINGSIVFPTLKGKDQSHPNSASISLKYKYEDRDVSGNEISFNLSSGENLWASTIVLPNDNTED